MRVVAMAIAMAIMAIAVMAGCEFSQALERKEPTEQELKVRLEKISQPWEVAYPKAKETARRVVSGTALQSQLEELIKEGTFEITSKLGYHLARGMAAEEGILNFTAKDEFEKAHLAAKELGRALKEFVPNGDPEIAMGTIAMGISREHVEKHIRPFFMEGWNGK